MSIHAVGTPAVSISEDLGLSVCQGTTVTFSAASSVFGGLSPIYIWTRSGIIQGSGITYSYAPANHDVISLLMISNDPCAVHDSATNNVTMAVQAPAAAPVFTISALPGINIGYGQRDTLKVVITSGGTPTPTYQWVLNGSPLPGETNSTYVSNNFFNKDSVSCIVTSTGICGGTPGAKGVVLNVRNTTGISQTASGSDIRVLPNPNKGVFTIKGTLGSAVDEEVSLEILNMVGQVVYKNNIMARNGIINEQVQLSNTLANGMYLLSVRSGSENNVFHFVIGQ
jgi:hypothetical protein